MSSENPALDFARCIENAWSAYEVIGEIIMNNGATKPDTNVTIPILKVLESLECISRGLLDRTGIQGRCSTKGKAGIGKENCLVEVLSA